MQSNRLSNNTISVIIPTYNRAAYIKDALESVLNQKLPINYKLEVIVIDDGSTDNTSEVLSPYLKKIVYKSIPNSGRPAVPRNIGIGIATGSIIAFQDSDDLWIKDKLLKQLPLFDDPQVMFSYGQAEIMNQDGTPINKTVVAEKLLVPITYAEMLKENPVSTLTAMLRKSVIDEVGAFNESADLRAIEDYDLWLRIASAFPKGLRPTKDTLAHYRKHDQNISQGDSLMGIENALKIYQHAWKTKTLSEKNRESLEKSITTMSENWSRYMHDNKPEEHTVVSVVMAVYNGEKFLRQAIDSILTQTYKNFEFIIIDDGSTDNTAEIILSYKDSRIRLVQQTNHKLVYSLNKAISLARGEFIARMDADDISMPSRLEKELLWISQVPTRGLVSSYFSLMNYEDGKPNGITIAFPVHHIDLRRALYLVNPFAHGSAMYRREAVVGLGMYTELYGPTEDYELWRRLSTNWEVGLVPDVLYWYRVNNPESISQKGAEIQDHFIQKIRDEEWRKPFVRKGIMLVRKGLHEIKHEVPYQYRSQVEAEYCGEVFAITKILLQRGKFLNGIHSLCGLFLIKPLLFFKLLPHVPSSFKNGIISQFKIRSQA